jgi:hypothetical protein
VRELATGDRRKREKIFKEEAQKKGINLSEKQVDQFELAWKSETSGEIPGYVPKEKLKDLDIGKSTKLGKTSKTIKPKAPKFDPGTYYAGSKFLLTWLKKPDDPGTKNLKGEGSWKEHAAENNARAAANNGDIEGAISYLEEAISIREDNFGGQLGLNQSHEKAIKFLNDIKGYLEDYL